MLGRVKRFVIVFAGLALSVTACLSADEQRVSLPVTLRPQETELWCWAATGQMVMEFLGKKVTQAEQANRFLGRADCNHRPVPTPCVRVSDPRLSYYGFTYDVTRKPLTESQIVEQIAERKKPILFGWNWKGGGGHLGVLVGFVQRDGKLMLEVLDPYPPVGKVKGNVSGGQRVFMTYSRWVRDANHSWAYAYFDITSPDEP